MKKLILLTISISMLFSACEKQNETDYSSLIIGQWINTKVDNKEVLTDSVFTFEFRPDLVETCFYGHKIDDNNSLWVSDTAFTYSVSDNIISIEGYNLYQKYFEIEFEILSLDQNTFSYTIPKFSIDNIDYPDQRIFTNERITSDLKTQLVGTWYGKSTNVGNLDTSFHYWDYFEDGSYDYYFQDESGDWINKPDNLGEYFLYGDFLATNFTNDFVSNAIGSDYECWSISIQDSVMSWSGLRENGKITSYEMEKVDGPPIQ